MSRIRGLELLFNIEKKNFKSKEDCLVAVFHCLLINENLQCVGIDDEWPETDSISTELLPEKWNSNQDVYSLRYSSKDRTSRILLKANKMDHILQVDAVMNEKDMASLPLTVDKYVSDDYSEYSSAYKDLESLSDSFHTDILQKLKSKDKKAPTGKKLHSPPRGSTIPSQPPLYERPPDSEDPFRHPRHPPPPMFPRIGGIDLDPFSGPGAGGMFMDPSNFGVPPGPTLPDFGVGGPGGLPRGAVPPGARFDPFMPPGVRRGGPNPDHFKPPDYDGYFM